MLPFGICAGFYRLGIFDVNIPGVSEFLSISRRERSYVTF